MRPPEEPKTDPAEDDSTGLPGFRSWAAVYLFVAVVFAGYVALLYLLKRIFS